MFRDRLRSFRAVVASAAVAVLFAGCAQKEDENLYDIRAYASDGYHENLEEGLTKADCQYAIRVKYSDYVASCWPAGMG